MGLDVRAPLKVQKRWIRRLGDADSARCAHPGRRLRNRRVAETIPIGDAGEVGPELCNGVFRVTYRPLPRAQAKV